MHHSHQYKLRKKWIVCINIKPSYFDDLLRMSRGNLNRFLIYLYEKYKKRLMHQRVSSKKRTATADYQTREKDYIRKKIRISPMTWQKYWDLRLNTGYSMSCILRIFIEWEKLERGEEVNNLYLAPEVIEDWRLSFRYPNQFRILDNYQIKRRVRRRGRRLFFKYWDDS